MSNQDHLNCPIIAYHIDRSSVLAGPMSKRLNESEHGKLQQYVKEHNMLLKPIVVGRSGCSSADPTDGVFKMLSQQGEAARIGGFPHPVLLITSVDRVTREGSCKAVARFLNLLESGVDIHIVDDGRKYTAADLRDTPQLMVELVLLLAEGTSRRRSLLVKEAWAEDKRVTPAVNGRFPTARFSSPACGDGKPHRRQAESGPTGTT